jgi:uncharacterized protein YbjQ (UPF0145 family)
MIVTTTDGVEGKRVTQYLGVVSGEAVFGANVFRDFFASVRDVIGGRAGGYENVLKDGKTTAISDMMEEAQALGANAIVGIDLDYENIGQSMLMVSANGTAVIVE